MFVYVLILDVFNLKGKKWVTKVGDTVFEINQILPNVMNAINGKDFQGLKIKQGTIESICEDDIGNGIILLFSNSSIIDILYKKNITSFLKKFESITNEDGFMIVLYDIEQVNSQEIALNMILNYLKLILDNCE